MGDITFFAKTQRYPITSTITCFIFGCFVYCPQLVNSGKSGMGCYWCYWCDVLNPTTNHPSNFPSRGHFTSETARLPQCHHLPFWTPRGGLDIETWVTISDQQRQSSDSICSSQIFNDFYSDFHFHSDFSGFFMFSIIFHGLNWFFWSLAHPQAQH